MLTGAFIFRKASFCPEVLYTAVTLHHLPAAELSLTL